MSKKLSLPAAVVALLCFVSVAARPRPRPQQPSATDLASVDNTLRQLESPQNSRIMWIEHELTDIYGPRLTGTPDLKTADDWAIRTMAAFGMSNTHLEPYPSYPSASIMPFPAGTISPSRPTPFPPFTANLSLSPCTGPRAPTAPSPPPLC